MIVCRYAARRVAVAERTTDEHPFRVLLTCYQLRGTVALAISHVFFFGMYKRERNETKRTFDEGKI